VAGELWHHHRSHGIHWGVLDSALRCTPDLSAQATTNSRKWSTLLIGISLRCCLRLLTTVWCTEPGTTLLIGLNSTADVSAYFCNLCLCQFAATAASRQVPAGHGPAQRALCF
jgi:hypothetical protein